MVKPVPAKHGRRPSKTEQLIRPRWRSRAARRGWAIGFQRPAHRHDHEVEFYAFDILVSDGEDVRKLPLSMRKASLSRLLARRVGGIFLSDFEHGRSVRTCFVTLA
jgi:hypothetical protein